MSEQVLERPTGQSEPEGKPGGRRTFLVVALAIVAGLVLGGAVLLLLGLGSEGDEQVAAPIPRGTPRVSATPTPSPTTTKKAKKSATEVVGRDPFAPLVTPKPTTAAATPKGGKATDPEDAAAAKASASAAKPTRSAEPTRANEPTKASAAAKASSGDTLAVVSISPLGDSLKLKLNGTKYEVAEGEAFAKHYRLYDIFNANCAGFLYGDANTVACVGDEVKM